MVDEDLNTCFKLRHIDIKVVTISVCMSSAMTNASSFQVKLTGKNLNCLASSEIRVLVNENDFSETMYGSALKNKHCNAISETTPSPGLTQCTYACTNVSPRVLFWLMFFPSSRGAEEICEISASI